MVRYGESCLNYSSFFSEIFLHQDKLKHDRPPSPRLSTIIETKKSEKISTSKAKPTILQTNKKSIGKNFITIDREIINFFQHQTLSRKNIAFAQRLNKCFISKWYIFSEKFFPSMLNKITGTSFFLVSQKNFFLLRLVKN